ncbi:Extracellular_nuclease [Hexamita inflata]|uniref:Extracellular nuclease n=1 Tax=Hexamita inflata TaxID=28002 RepID=A0AA86R8Z8_9EUKA|nr:Extracellular nuclease [Hexamita inflata]
MYGYVYNTRIRYTRCIMMKAVYCVYTGLRIPCQYNSMRSSCSGDLRTHSSIITIQKLDPMVSDLHHSWKTTNSARANLSFEQLTLFINSYNGNYKQVQFEQPNDLENWSVLETDNAFMPRDEQKGDTARAVAYFYTRYPTEGGNIDQVFNYIDTMIEWDLIYSPSDLQYERGTRQQKSILRRNRPYCYMSIKSHIQNICDHNMHYIYLMITKKDVLNNQIFICININIFIRFTRTTNLNKINRFQSRRESCSALMVKNLFILT